MTSYGSPLGTRWSRDRESLGVTPPALDRRAVGQSIVQGLS